MLEDVGHVVIVDEDDGETFTLALEGANAQDSGVYKCVATNTAGTVTSSATLQVTSAEPGKLPNREAGKPSEIIKPQRREETSTQPTFDGKSIDLKIDGDSMTVLLPDAQTIPDEQPTTKIADQRPISPKPKPTTPKEKRSPPEKAPKIASKKSLEDKTTKNKPKATKQDETQDFHDKEISFTIDSESGLMSAPDVLFEQKIGEPFAEKKKPGKVQSKPADNEISFTIDAKLDVVDTPLPSAEGKDKIPDGRPQVAESSPWKDQAKPLEPVGKEVSFTIDSGSILMASPEEEIRVRPKSRKPEVAEKKTPGKTQAKPFEPVGKERNFTIESEAGLMASPEHVPDQQIPQKPKPRQPGVAEKKKIGKDQTKPFEKEIVANIDTESLSLASPEIPPDQERKKQKGQKPKVAGKGEESRPFETVRKPVSLRIDDGFPLITSPEEGLSYKPEAKLAPSTLEKPTKGNPQDKDRPIDSGKDRQEKPVDKTGQKQPKDTPPKVASKTMKDKTQRTLEKDQNAKPTKDQQRVHGIRPIEKRPEGEAQKVAAPKVAPKPTGKPVEVRIDSEAMTISLPTEEIIIPEKESGEQFLAPESESGDNIKKSPEEKPPLATGKPPSEPPSVKSKPKKPVPEDISDEDLGKLAYTTKREDGLPVWARRPRKDKPAKGETPSAKKTPEKSTKPSKSALDKNEPDKPAQHVGKEPEREPVKPAQEVPKPVELEIGQNVQILLGPDEDIPKIRLKAKDQSVPVKPEVKSKPKQPAVKPKKSEKEQKPEHKKADELNRKPVVQKPFEDAAKEVPKEVEFVFKLDTSQFEAAKPEVKPKDVRKPHECVQDKKDKPRGKPEKNIPEWAQKGRTKDIPPPVKPKTKPKSAEIKKSPGGVEPEVELREGEDAQLKVQFDAAQPANVEWFKDGTKLDNEPQYTSKTSGDGCELLVRNVTPRDSGTYVCVITTEAGRSTKIFNLFIEGKREISPNLL